MECSCLLITLSWPSQKGTLTMSSYCKSSMFAFDPTKNLTAMLNRLASWHQDARAHWRRCVYEAADGTATKRRIWDVAFSVDGHPFVTTKRLCGSWGVMSGS